MPPRIGWRPRITVLLNPRIPTRSVCFHVQRFRSEEKLNYTIPRSPPGCLDTYAPCQTMQLMTCGLKHAFLPVVYGLLFVLGVTGNSLVIVVLGCQPRFGYVLFK